MALSTGQCLCGQITVSIPKESLVTSDKIILCHCKNCRQASGSLGAMSNVVLESAVKLTGEPKIYQDTNTGSGKPAQRAFVATVVVQSILLHLLYRAPR